MTSSSARLVSSTRKIVAIGRNYSEHAKELGNAVPSSPLFFLKPPSSLIVKGPIEIPKSCEIHHEVELALVVGKTARDVSEENAMSIIDGYVLALDMTARNLQEIAKKKGQPWSACKGFDTFTPISEFIPKSAIPHPESLIIWCKVNDKLKQSGKTADMIFSIPRLISHVSQFMTLEKGDIILTGTPSGVGPVFPGEIVEAGLRREGEKEDVVVMKFPAIARPGHGMWGTGI